jgi:hypothetical protein
MVAQSAVDEREQLSFDFLPDLPVVVQRHQGRLSSDAGLLPIRQFDQRWNFTGRMAACLHDPKSDDRVHSLTSMLRQRLYGILAGYEDCNDHDTLRDDPVFKLVADRRPDDPALASQPTLSRFENLATPARCCKSSSTSTSKPASSVSSKSTVDNFPRRSRWTSTPRMIRPTASSSSRSSTGTSANTSTSR